MDSQQEMIRFLLEKVKSSTATAEECDQLLQLVNGDQHNEVLGFINRYYEDQLLVFGQEGNPEWKSMLENIVSVDKESGDVQTAPTLQRRVHFIRKWGWAAAVIVLLGAGGYLWISNNKPERTIATVNTPEITPGHEGAILTLADGRKIVLDSLGSGVVANQNGANVLLNNGRLDYNPTGETSAAVTYNMMSTPKGRQFNIQLPDGTIAWLNAASSIRYPTAFSGNERRVEVTGEVYFEVAKNARMPFRVNVNNKAEVEVLGTHFNVNAYDNEAVLNTTLIEGSVKVNGTTIKPGQQALVANSDAVNNGKATGVRVVDNVNTGRVMAWKNGLFNFEGATIGEIMRQIERWYDIEVVYEKGEPTVEFEGKMTKDVSLNGLIILLEKSGLHLRLEGRKLIVLP